MRAKRTLLVATAVSSLLVGVGIAGAQAPGESSRNAPGANAPAATGSQHGPSSQHGTSSEPRAQSQGSPQGSMGNRAQQSSPNNRMGQSEPSRGTQTDQMERRQPAAQTEKNQSDRNRGAAQNERGRNENHGTVENRSNEKSGSAGTETTGKTEQNRTNENRGTVGSEDRSRMDQNRGTAERSEGNRGASASLSTSQRTKIRDSVIHESNAPRISRSDINVELRVGARIPQDRIRVRPLPLPSSIVEIEPQWRGYLYFLAGDEVVVVEPGTYEVVAVIPA